jgi:hypothetical protein
MLKQKNHETFILIYELRLKLRRSYSIGWAEKMQVQETNDKSTTSGIVYLFLLLIISFLNFAQAECLSEHLEAAYTLNELRKPLYSELTEGESERISDFLIKEEKKAYWPARATEWTFRHHHRAGIPILCEDFIPMSQAPDFSYDEDRTPLEEDYVSKDVDAIQERLLEAFDGRNFNALGEQAVVELKDFSSTSYNCMTRHILESIGRSAFLAERYIEASDQMNLSNPSFRLWVTLRIKIHSMSEVKQIDQWAAPIQKTGVPIICNDVPHIPIYSSWSFGESSQ